VFPLKRYLGNRDPRFVAIHRGGDLDVTTHRLLVAWAADCAEHVLHLFTEVHPNDTRPDHAIVIARQWASGNATVEQARQAAFGAHAAARESPNPAASDVARSAGHAVATAHMADHELGAAAYAIRAAIKSVDTLAAMQATEMECHWQHSQLSKTIRQLVLSDQQNRNPKFKNLFFASLP
jgi:hypothetical protein